MPTHLEILYSRLAVIEYNSRRFGVHKTLVENILRGEGLVTPNIVTISTRASVKGKPRESFLEMIQ